MDNSAYVPNQLPPPLVVFSQAGGFSEAALRMQRPFNPQIGDSAKDLHNPFSQTAASIDYRLHQMLHLQHPFLHPLDHRFVSSAFRPLAPSAFTPPPKRLKLESEPGGPGPGGPGTPQPPPSVASVIAAAAAAASTAAAASVVPSIQVSPSLSSLGSLSSMSSMFSPSLTAASSQPGGPGSQPGSAADRSTGEQGHAPQSPANSTSSRSPLGSSAGSANQGHAPGGAATPGNQEHEERETASATPCSENTERSTPEEGRPYRMGNVFGGRGCGAEALGLFNPAYRITLPPGLAKSNRCLVFDQGKKKFQADPTCCPVCGITVRPQDLEQHFLQELDRLLKLSSASSRPRPPRPASLQPPGPDHPNAGQFVHTPSSADGTPYGRWETYKRIKANRQSRIRIKNRKRKADEPACPVCSERLSGTPEELNLHVERCLNKHNGNPDRAHMDDEEVDVEGDTETFEEYEWAGQRRVRASSMLMGGYSAAGLATSSSNRSSSSGPNGTQDDEDVDLVVDGDENAAFGPAQYTEADVVTPRHEGTAREQKEREALRDAVISPNGTTVTAPGASTTPYPAEIKTEPSSSPGGSQQQSGHEGDEAATAGTSRSSPTGATLDPKSEAETPVVEALRCRIRELEAEMRSQPFKCLICMEQYKKPVISVCCWHVHCESCWLHTLGAKKLCPQCNMITSPSDLRRIYM